MLDSFFWVDGERSDLVGINLQVPITFGSAEPKLTSTKIPGRNGNLLVYDGTYANVKGYAECFALAPELVDEALSAVTKWAMQQTGYRRLEVSEEPAVFRLAAIASGPETEIRMRTLAPFNLEFDCCPQKFYKRGELPIILPAGGAARLMNPGFPALPLITIYGTGAGTLTVAGVTVNFLGNFAGPVILDCDTQNAYFAGTNKNTEIYAPEFPVLPAGECPISWAGGVERVEIVPRWWTL